MVTLFMLISSSRKLTPRGKWGVHEYCYPHGQQLAHTWHIGNAQYICVVGQNYG